MTMGPLQYTLIGLTGACCIAFTVTNGVYIKRLTGCGTAQDCKKDGQITLAMTILIAFIVIFWAVFGKSLL